jgi:hypothetical protein
MGSRAAAASGRRQSVRRTLIRDALARLCVGRVRLIVGIHVVVVIGQRLLGNRCCGRRRILSRLVADRRQLDWSASGIG